MSLVPLDPENIESLLHVDVAPLCFGFAYGGVTYEARYNSQGAEGGLLLKARIGPLPYSTESGLVRNGLLTIMKQANDHLGSAFGLMGNDLYVLCQREVAGSLTSLGILGTAVQHVLPILPYLDLVFFYLTPPDHLTKGGASLRPEWRPKVRTTGFRKAMPSC